MTTRLIPVTLEDAGLDNSSYWTARHAVTVAIKHHESALKGIERRKGMTLATVRAKRSHDDALTHLHALMDLLVKSRVEVIDNEGAKS